MSMKKKILLPIVSDLSIRTFFDAGAFDQLANEYELHFIVPNLVTKEVPHKPCYA
jgi:hypothetical protein